MDKNKLYHLSSLLIILCIAMGVVAGLDIFGAFSEDRSSHTWSLVLIISACVVGITALLVQERSFRD